MECGSEDDSLYSGSQNAVGSAQDGLSDVGSDVNSTGEIGEDVELNCSAIKNDSRGTRGEIYEQTSGGSDTQIIDDEDEHDEYGINRQEFDTTEKELEKLRKEYKIPDDITLRLVREDEIASKVGDGGTVVYIEMFKLGFRLPIQPYFARMLVTIGLSPGQLDPNGWMILGGMYVVWAEQNRVEPCFKEFSHLYLCNENGIGHKGWYYFMSKSNDRRVVLDFPGSCKRWKSKYFVVGGNWGKDVELTKGWFKVPTQFDRAATWKKNFGISERLRVRVVRGLRHAEDWKRLLTPERLVSAGLILSQPPNQGRKGKKGNMSVAKRTPAEIAKALAEEMSDEEGEPHSKKPRRAVHKSKADEKKEKQLTGSVPDIPSRDKDDLVGNSRPLCILPPTSSSICPKKNLLEVDDIIESKRGKVGSLLPIVNLAARSVSQSSLDDLSHLSADHALEMLARKQAEQSLLMAAHIETFRKSLKGHAKIEELECALTKAKLNNEKIMSERDRLKHDLNSRDEDNARLAKDLVIEKQANGSKDAKIAELNNEFEKITLDVDRHVRLEKKKLKADVIQTCIELFQEKHPDLDFQWMLTAYVNKEKARRNFPDMDRGEMHDQVFQGNQVPPDDGVAIEGNLGKA